MGVVEIRPNSGVFDYTSKYTKGLTEYLAPAPIDEALASAARGRARRRSRRAGAATTRASTSCSLRKTSCFCSKSTRFLA